MQGGPATVHGLFPLSQTACKHSRSQGAADGWPHATPAFQRLQRTPFGARADQSLSGVVWGWGWVVGGGGGGERRMYQWVRKLSRRPETSSNKEKKKKATEDGFGKCWSVCSAVTQLHVWLLNVRHLLSFRVEHALTSGCRANAGGYSLV